MFFKNMLILVFAAASLLLGSAVIANDTSCVSIGAAATRNSSHFHLLSEKLDGFDHAVVYYNPRTEANQASPYTWVARSYLDRGTDVILALILKSENDEGNLANINEGAFDRDLRKLAKAIRADGRPIVVRPLYEFNGSWYSWQSYYRDNRVGDFIPAWRHVVSIFREEGAPVLFDLNYNRRSAGKRGTHDFVKLYPGDDFVDVISVSSYNRCGAGKNHTSWKRFRDDFDPAYKALTTLTSKPIAVAETSTTEICEGDKALWYRDLFRDIESRYPQVVNVTFYLDTVKAGDASNEVALHWELETFEQETTFRDEKELLRTMRGECPSTYRAGVPFPETMLRVKEPNSTYDIKYPWSVFIEGTSYLDETYTDELNPVTGNPFGERGDTLRWRFKQGAEWDIGNDSTFGPWVSFDGVQSSNDNRWWDNRHGLGAGVSLCSEKPAFGDWGDLCAILGYQRDWYTAPTPERLEGGEDRIYLRIRFNTGGEW